MNTTTAPALGDLIRSRRLALGFTQHDLSVRTGITQSAISTFEQGHVTPTFATIARLRAALEVADAEFATWAEAVQA